MINRCEWVGNNPLMINYHDEEWGVPVHSDEKLFEFILLDTFQAGLSWEIILNKREGFRRAFQNFSIQKISNYDNEHVNRLMKDAGIIRNEQKIRSAIENAKKFIEVQKEFGSFDKYIWRFTNYDVINNHYSNWKSIPAKSSISEKMSLDLKKRGFKFVGATICYAFMQAAGMINDHTKSCYKYDEKKLKR